MSSTRDFKSPGIFAEDATTTIPPTPIAGVAYRDAVTGTDDTVNGWRYGTRVESQDWNQVMFMLTSMLGMMDKQGILGWSDEIDYSVPALVFGSDGLPYIALQASGPTTAAQDPVSAPTFWEQFAIHGRVVLTSTQSWAVPMAMQLGYVRPFVHVKGGGGGGGTNANSGGGGGGGGTASAVVNLTGVSSVSVVVGDGGAASADGGATSFGAFCAASGGGAAVGGSGQDGALGGIGTIGDVLDTLGPGGQRHSSGTGVQISGKGGGPGGGKSAEGGTIVGFTATGFGCGGGGGTGGAAGGTGKAGVVVIEW